MKIPDRQKNDMKTMVDCTNKLYKLGFSTQFKAKSAGLESLTTNKVFKPEEVKVVNFYRFEGESDPSDNSILFAIETNSGEKGTLTDAYGAYNDPKVTKFIQKVDSLKKKVNKEETL